jgi:hypothetical protein
MIHQDSAHHLRRDRKEVQAVPPIHPLADQPQIGLVNQRRRLKGMAGALATQIRRRLPPEFLIHQRQKIVLRARVAVRPGMEQRRHLSCSIAHVGCHGQF